MRGDEVVIDAPWSRVLPVMPTLGVRGVRARCRAGGSVAQGCEVARACQHASPEWWRA